jgi:glycosyltransferase involved in cell wall biosynthesis
MTLAKARFVTTESKFAVGFLQQRFPHLSIHQIEHAPNWTFHQIERQPVVGTIRFLTNASASFRKGTDLFFMALNELAPELKFEVLFVGSRNEPYTDPILAGLSPELRRRISFKSNLSAEEVARELSAATIFLLPTRADTSPNAVKEAVVAGVPVVASDVGGIPDYVRPGENGFLFPSGDRVQFVAAIKSALAHPLFSRGLVAPASLKVSREYLSPSRMAQSFLSVYHTVKDTGSWRV